MIAPRRLTYRPPPFLDPLNCLETRSRSFWRPSIQTLLGGGLRPPPRRVSGRGSGSFWSEFQDSLGGRGEGGDGKLASRGRLLVSLE